MPRTIDIEIDAGARDAHFNAQTRAAEALVEAAAAVDDTLPAWIERTLAQGGELLVQHRFNADGPVCSDLCVVFRNGSEAHVARLHPSTASRALELLPLMLRSH